MYVTLLARYSCRTPRWITLRNTVSTTSLQLNPQQVTNALSCPKQRYQLWHSCSEGLPLADRYNKSVLTPVFKRPRGSHVSMKTTNSAVKPQMPLPCNGETPDMCKGCAERHNNQLLLLIFLLGKAAAPGEGSWWQTESNTRVRCLNTTSTSIWQISGQRVKGSQPLSQGFLLFALGWLSEAPRKMEVALGSVSASGTECSLSWQGTGRGLVSLEGGGGKAEQWGGGGGGRAKGRRAGRGERWRWCSQLFLSVKQRLPGLAETWLLLVLHHNTDPECSLVHTTSAEGMLLCMSALNFKSMLTR